MSRGNVPLAVDEIDVRGEQTITGLTAGLARAFAFEAGFSEAGLVALPYEGAARDATRFEAWVQEGRAGTMDYLARTGEGGQLDLLIRRGRLR